MIFNFFSSFVGITEPVSEEKIPKTISNSDQVRFKYDSSDSEDGERESTLKKQSTKKTLALNAGGKVTKSGIFRQNFFIFPGDKRLEGKIIVYTTLLCFLLIEIFFNRRSKILCK